MIIYKIQNKINGKIYIGLTTKIDWWKRIIEHSSGRKDKNSVIHCALIKYGLDNFNINVIDTCKNKKELIEKEKYWIKFYSSCDRNKGYNITNGGDGCRSLNGYRLSNEHKKKLSEAHKGIICHTIPHTEETKKKISKSNTGKLNSHNQSKQKKVFCLNDNKEYPSIESCARYYKVFPQNLLKVLKNLRKSTGGFKFKFI